MHPKIGQKTKNRFRDSIRGVIKGLSKRILVYKQPIKHECPNCYYDKLTAKSTGKCKWSLDSTAFNYIENAIDDWLVINFDNDRSEAPYKYFRVGRCPICKGAGFIETKRKTWVDCLVIWGKPSNDDVYTPAGMEGATTLQLKTDPKYYNLFKDCSHIVVNGIECKISKAPICRGLGNQSVLVISAFTTDKPKIDNREIIKDYS